MKVDVSLQGKFVIKLFATGGAGVAGSGVHLQVLLKIALNLKLLITDTTNKNLSLVIHFMCSCVL